MLNVFKSKNIRKIDENCVPGDFHQCSWAMAWNFFQFPLFFTHFPCTWKYNFQNIVLYTNWFSRKNVIRSRFEKGACRKGSFTFLWWYRMNELLSVHVDGAIYFSKSAISECSKNSWWLHNFRRSSWNQFVFIRWLCCKLHFLCFFKVSSRITSTQPEVSGENSSNFPSCSLKWWNAKKSFHHIKIKY